MKVNSFSGNVFPSGYTLPFSDSPFVLSDELFSGIDPNRIDRCPYCNFLAYILDRDAVKSTVILDMEITPDSCFFPVIRLVILNLNRGQPRTPGFFALVF